jgi:hypothetical protein
MVIVYSRLTSGQRHCPERLFRKFTMEAFSLRAVWDEEYREAWFLISDQPAGRRRIQEYAWRMRVEATFEDAKSRGWDLEASLIEDRERLNRLLLALFLAMWWVIHLAASCFISCSTPSPSFARATGALAVVVAATTGSQNATACNSTDRDHGLWTLKRVCSGARFARCLIVKW